jgi:hypothetical protein
VSCQHLQQPHQQNKRQASYPQYYPVHTQFSLQQHHPTSQPTAATITQHQPHHYFQSTTASSYVDLDRFNQYAKTALKSVNYFNQQEQKNLKQHVNSVHQDGNEPHFDFMVNSNYSDLEKASEQFVNLGSMAAKQNMPKVIKITKTVAVKQPVPVPYPVPIYKVVKEQVPMETPQTYSHPHNSYISATTQAYSHQHNSYATTPSSAPVTEKPYDFKPSPYFSNYTSYINKYPENTSAHKIAESYIKQELFSTVQTATGPAVEYDTRPFYVRTSDKEMIKYIPVPYYVDEEGNRHEIKSSSSPTSASYETSNNQQQSDAYYHKQAEENAGKFSSSFFSYHPTPSPTSPTPAYHHYGAQPMHATPETSKYYLSHDNTVSPSSPTVQHYAVASEQVDSEGYSSASVDDEHQHYQYKYVYERR